MRNYIKCESCNTYHWSDGICADGYLVYYEYYSGDEPHTINAWSFDDAACQYAEYYDVNSDYSLMNETIEIKIIHKGEVKNFRIGAELDIHYTSDEI